MKAYELVKTRDRNNASRSCIANEVSENTDTTAKATRDFLVSIKTSHFTSMPSRAELDLALRDILFYSAICNKDNFDFQVDRTLLIEQGSNALLRRCSKVRDRKLTTSFALGLI